MAKKRSHNEGSIYKRRDGYWRAQVTIDGQRLSFTAKTQKECRDWVRATLNEIDDGLSYNATKITVESFLADWLIIKESSILQKTLAQYGQVARDHISNEIGTIKIRELKPEQIQKLYTRKLDAGMGERTVREIHAVLHNALNHALRLGIIKNNPASLVNPPRAKRKEMKFFDQTQVQQLLITAQNQNDRYLPLFKLAITTGMRQAELLGLKWQDLDFFQRSLSISRQLKLKPGGGFFFDPPKSKAGNRTIILGQSTVNLLREHRKRVNEDMIRAGEKWIENDLIFPNLRGNPTFPDKIIKRFKRLIREAGLPEIRFHDLRHTAASLMLNNGVPVIVVSKRLGHSQASITLDVYGHLIPNMQKQVADLMDEITTPIEIKIPFYQS